MCIYVHVLNEKVHSSKVSLHWLVECVYMRGDVNIHVKFRISKYGKYTNFIIAMSVVLLAACPSI